MLGHLVISFVGVLDWFFYAGSFILIIYKALRGLFVSKYPFSCNTCLLRPRLIRRSYVQSAPSPTFALKPVNRVRGFCWFFHEGLERPRGEFCDEEDEREEARQQHWLSCHSGSAAAPPALSDQGHLFSTGSIHLKTWTAHRVRHREKMRHVFVFLLLF